MGNADYPWFEGIGIKDGEVVLRYQREAATEGLRASGSTFHAGVSLYSPVVSEVHLLDRIKDAVSASGWNFVQAIPVKGTNEKYSMKLVFKRSDAKKHH